MTTLALVALLHCGGEESLPPTEEPPETTQPAPAPEFPTQEPVVCAEVDQSYTEVVPTVLLVVDRSGSMSDPFGKTTRWNAVYQTLMDASTGVVRVLANEVRFGISLFNNPGDQCPTMQTVAPALRNAQAIDELYAPLRPAGDTPTGMALQSLIPTLAGEPGPRFIVLATDGLPDTCEVPNPDGLPAAREAAVAATRTAFEQGIVTYVLSVGPDVAEDHLQAVANAGLGLPEESQEAAPYFVALDPAELVAAFDEIMNDVRYCTFSFADIDMIGGEGEGYELVGARVTVDGAVLTQGVDWQMVGDDTVQLLGPACDQVLDGSHEIKAELMCQIVLE